MSGNSKILFCSCAHYTNIPPEIKERTLDRMHRSDATFIVTSDLCGLCAEKHPLLADTSVRKIFACYPRAVRWLLHAAGVNHSAEKIEIVNLRALTAEQVESHIDVLDTLAENNASVQIESKNNWIPWFPVIDYSRCKNCKQCASFCLFGVYQLDAAGKVYVAQPQNCKTNCPACARICPEAAIMFPKIAEAPINGAEIDDEAKTRAMIQLNIDKMLGDNVYAALAERQRKAKKLQLQKQAEKE